VKALEDVRQAPHRQTRPVGGRSNDGPRSGAVQSILRALGILNGLSDAEDGMTLTRIAERVGLPPSTVHRLLTTLEQERYVRFDSERRLWSVGVQMFLAGCAFLKSRDLVGAARPFMRTLLEEFGETVNLAVQDDGDAMYIHRIERPAAMLPLAKPDGRVPLYCSGVGKALLAGRADSELEILLPVDDARRLTNNTLVSRTALREDIALTRERGFAVDDEEHAVGLRCVAAPVFNELREPMAAISISGPATRISPSSIPRLGAQLRQAAAGITAKLGGAMPAAFRRI
jgi:IclR family acetate operon transcriptional repressor